MANKRLTLEEQLEKDMATLKAMEEAFAEKQKALKEQIANKKKRYNAKYNKKRTHMLCTVAPIFLSIFGLQEDGTMDRLDELEAQVKAFADTLTDNRKEGMRKFYNQQISLTEKNE